MESNYSIKCDVTRCKHNLQGQNCRLTAVKITSCCGEHCTCCGDFCEEENC